MIFDELMYRDNNEKEKMLKNMEIEIMKIFKEYKNAWNEFCKQISPTGEVPILKKSIEKNRIEESLVECLEEIDNAIKELANIVKNAIEKLELKELIGKNDYRLEKLQPNVLRIMIKCLIPIVVGITGIGFASLVANQLLVQAEEMYWPMHIIQEIPAGSTLFAMIYMITIDGLLTWAVAENNKGRIKKRLEQENKILDELKRTMVRETNNLIKITQSIKDGVIWIDKETMYLIDEKKSKITLVKIGQI
ncbi:MAG: hypothetical protein ACRCSG_05160 [Cellulosilyticaceae bacterium]